jgi:hypothetical protein
VGEPQRRDGLSKARELEKKTQKKKHSQYQVETNMGDVAGAAG